MSEYTKIIKEALIAELDRHEYDGDNMCTCGDSCGGTTDGVMWTIETNAHLAEAILATGYRLEPEPQVPPLEEPWPAAKIIDRSAARAAIRVQADIAAQANGFTDHIAEFDADYTQWQKRASLT